ncbi:MAG TPA: amino acid transporter [Actinobacteria bacterium]|nr:amino acid transporter [Actinomycetota bacterium]HCK79069.1 amino acid transporter [Actinomycetota bacterium]
MRPSAGTPAIPALDRALGLGSVTISGIGIIVGAGIYVLIGPAAAVAGSGVWISFLLAGVMCAFTALSYAELASMFPRAGAEYEYASHVFSPRVSFVIGWFMAVGLIIATAAVALGFGNYLSALSGMTPTLSAALLIITLGAICLTGIRFSAAIMVTLSIIEVAGLVAVMIAGAPVIQVGRLVGELKGVSGLLGGVGLVFFAFIGFDEVNTLAEETVNPARTIPRALLLALAISTFLYVGVAVTAVGVLGPTTLSTSTTPLADVIKAVSGPTGATVLSYIALAATANTALLALTAASRLQFGMAEEGALPRWMMSVGPRSKAPRATIITGVLGALAFVLIGDISVVAGVTDLAVLLVLLAVNVCVIVLRRRAPRAPRPFRSPWTVRGIPLLAVLGIFSVLGVLPTLSLRVWTLGAIVLLIGLGTHEITRRSSP